MRILVVGGFDGSDAEQKERIGAFTRALGSAIADHGHVLLNGCRTEFDALVVEAAHEKLGELGEAERERRIISYVLAGHTPAHDCGTITLSPGSRIGKSPRRHSIFPSRSSRRTRSS